MTRGSVARFALSKAYKFVGRCWQMSSRCLCHTVALEHLQCIQRPRRNQTVLTLQKEKSSVAGLVSASNQAM